MRHFCGSPMFCWWAAQCAPTLARRRIGLPGRARVTANALLGLRACMSRATSELAIGKALDIQAAVSPASHAPHA